MKQKSIIWRVLALLFFAFLWGGSLEAYAEKKPWVKYDENEQTLTFYCTDKGALGDNEFELNKYDWDPGWIYKNQYITKAVFDKSFADARPTSCYSWFENCWQLKAIEGIENLNTSEVKYMGAMFYCCYLLEQLDLSHFNTSNVTTMSFMFYDCQKLTSLDVSSFDTKNVNYMVLMFAGTKGLSSLDLSNFDTSNVTRMENMFDRCSGLKELNISSFNTSNVTKMECMFNCCSNLETIYASDKFVTDGVTSDNDMFNGCTNLKGEINCDGTNNIDKTYAKVNGGYFLDAAKHTFSWAKYDGGTLTFQYGLKRALEDYEYPLNDGADTPKWQGNALSKVNSGTTKVVFDKSFAKVRPTTCYQWFRNFEYLASVEGLENLNTSSVTNMAEMFSSCYKLPSLDLSHFNTSNVTNMTQMFGWCKELQALDLSSFNTSNVTDMSGMFRACYQLQTLDLSSFSTSAVKNMNSMFCDCDVLKELNLSGFNTSNVENMALMFKGCYILKYILAGEGFATTNVSQSDKMFSSCRALPGYDADSTDKAKAKNHADGGYFYTVAELTRPWVRLADGTLTFSYGLKADLDSEKEFLLNDGDSSPKWIDKYSTTTPGITKVVFDKSFATARPTTCCNWFTGCTNLSAIEGIEYLNTSETTNMRGMFNICESLESLDVSRFNTGNVTDMSSMFNYCRSLEALDVSKFSTVNVTDMSNMFSYCSSLATLDLSHFDTQKVTTMSSMFRDCYSLKSLDLTSFDMHNVKSMVFMFLYSSRLKSIYVSDKFTAKEDVTYNSMLKDCPAYLYCQPSQYDAIKGNPFTDNIRPYVSINANAPFGTLCVPFGSTLSEGSYSGFDKLYRVTGANPNEGTITFETATSIEPGVAYVYRRNLPEDAAENIITFTPDGTKPSVSAPQNDGNMLKGTFASTYAPKGCYILLTDGNFHPVTGGYTNPVGAYRAYLDLRQTASGEATMAQTYRMVFVDGEVTGIGGISDNGANDQTDQQPKAIYDLSGRRVTVPQKGGIYIVNGKKIMYNK